MDVTVQLPTDPVERRRVQNRIAQRKFRRKSPLLPPVLSEADRGCRGMRHSRQKASEPNVVLYWKWPFLCPSFTAGIIQHTRSSHVYAPWLWRAPFAQLIWMHRHWARPRRAAHDAGHGLDRRPRLGVL